MAANIMRAESIADFIRQIDDADPRENVFSDLDLFDEQKIVAGESTDVEFFTSNAASSIRQRAKSAKGEVPGDRHFLVSEVSVKLPKFQSRADVDDLFETVQFELEVDNTVIVNKPVCGWGRGDGSQGYEKIIRVPVILMREKIEYSAKLKFPRALRTSKPLYVTVTLRGQKFDFKRARKLGLRPEKD